jgi:hypothetical protein
MCASVNVSTLFTHTSDVSLLNPNKRKCANTIIPNISFNMHVKFNTELSLDNFEKTHPRYIFSCRCIVS